MYRFLLITFLFGFISCSTSRESSRTVYNINDINSLLALNETIKTEYPRTECGLNTIRIANARLKKSLNMLNISSISIKYAQDTLNSNEYFYGNTVKLPDSCIIFSKEEQKTIDAQITSTLLFYFFSNKRPIDFRFNTHDPITEKTKKINDSIWIYKSVHQLIVIH